jgi:hypothetical protein
VSIGFDHLADDFDLVPDQGEAGRLAQAYEEYVQVNGVTYEADPVITKLFKEIVMKGKLISPVYPEHNKLKAVAAESQKLGSFLDWLKDEDGGNLVLAETVKARNGFNDEDLLTPSQESIECILSRYFSIDLKKLEEEKLEMLRRMVPEVQL